MAHRVRGWFADLARWYHAQSRPTRAENARRLRERGESLDSIVVRDAVASDIPALAELHVALWNATYRTSRGPGVATRVRQWTELFAAEPRRDFVVLLEDRDGRLIGFAAGWPEEGEFPGQLAKIYLRWEYHGLGLGRRLMQESARRFLARGMDSFILFAERNNPSIGFYDRMGGERLTDERGVFTGAYCWRDVRRLLA
jgi:ribosomal protein S18 acetylase RimI-like enzyme